MTKRGSMDHPYSRVILLHLGEEITPIQFAGCLRLQGVSAAVVDKGSHNEGRPLSQKMGRE